PGARWSVSLQRRFGAVDSPLFAQDATHFAERRQAAERFLHRRQQVVGSLRRRADVFERFLHGGVVAVRADLLELRSLAAADLRVELQHLGRLLILDRQGVYADNLLITGFDALRLAVRGFFD